MAEMALYERDYAWRGGAGSTERRVGAGEVSTSKRRNGSGQTGFKAESVVRFLLALTTGLVAFALLSFFLVLPLTQIRGFSMIGSLTLSLDEVRAWSGIPDKAYLFTLDSSVIRTNLEAHPKIAFADVKLAFPNRLIVSVTERLPVAVVYARAASGRIEAHCVDASAVVFASASEYPGTKDLPVISGVEIRGLHYGIKIGRAHV